MKMIGKFLVATYPGRQWLLPNGGGVADIDWLDGDAPADIDAKLAAYDPDAPTAPQSIAKAQGQVQLAIEGKYQAVVAYIDAIADPTQKLLAQIAFNSTNEWFMDSPFLNQAATDLGWMTDPEYLNEFFTAASKIKL